MRQLLVDATDARSLGDLMAAIARVCGANVTGEEARAMVAETLRATHRIVIEGVDGLLALKASIIFRLGIDAPDAEVVFVRAASSEERAPSERAELLAVADRVTDEQPEVALRSLLAIVPSVLTWGGAAMLIPRLESALESARARSPSSIDDDPQRLRAFERMKQRAARTSADAQQQKTAPISRAAASEEKAAGEAEHPEEETRVDPRILGRAQTVLAKLRRRARGEEDADYNDHREDLTSRDEDRADLEAHADLEPHTPRQSDWRSDEEAPAADLKARKGRSDREVRMVPPHLSSPTLASDGQAAQTTRDEEAREGRQAHSRAKSEGRSAHARGAESEGAPMLALASDCSDAALEGRMLGVRAAALVDAGEDGSGSASAAMFELAIKVLTRADDWVGLVRTLLRRAAVRRGGMQALLLTPWGGDANHGGVALDAARSGDANRGGVALDAARSGDGNRGGVALDAARSDDACRGGGGALEDARVDAGRAHDLALEINDAAGVAMALLEIARCLVEMDDDDALKWIDRARFAGREARLLRIEADADACELRFHHARKSLASPDELLAFLASGGGGGALVQRVVQLPSEETVTDAVRADFAKAVTLSRRSSDLRIALRVCRLRLDEEARLAAFDSERTELVIAEDGMWFEMPPSSERIHLTAHPALAALLLRLAQAHTGAHASRGKPVHAQVLINTAWPGERIAEAAAQNRLRVACASLRKLGMKEALITKRGGPDGGGYMIDPSLAVRIANTSRQARN